MTAESGLATGSIIGGQFRIVARLGAGGMGEVYLADQFAVDRKVVVKIVHPGIAALHPSVLERFKREARSLAQISHPNIVHLYAYGDAGDGHPYLAMEFVPGGTLETLLARGPLALERSIRIALQVGHALREAHARDVVHRDLKPANIMVNAAPNGDQVKLVDFGIAKALDEPGKLTQPGALFGTPRYMSPEQARGLPVDGRSDIYSFGLILYEMLTGAGPFNAKTPYDFIAQQVSTQPEPPSKKRLHVPARLDAIVLRCLEKDPGRRYPNAGELVREIEADLAEIDAGLARPALASVPVREEPDEETSRVPDVEAVAPARDARKREVSRGSILLRLAPFPVLLALVYSAVPHDTLEGMFARFTDKVEQVTTPRETRPDPAKDGPTEGSESAAQDKATAGLTLFCLNGFGALASLGYARYTSWADPVRGPSGKRVLGVYSLNDPKQCLDQITSMKGGVSETLWASAEAYGKALQKLAQQLRATDAYYATNAYEDDGFAKGHALHASLLQSYAAFFAAYQPLRAQLAQALERRDAGPDPLDRFRVAVRRALASAVAGDATFSTQLAALTDAQAAFDAVESGGKCDNAGIHVHSRMFVTAARQYAKARQAAQASALAGLLQSGNSIFAFYNVCAYLQDRDVELEFVTPR